jgi:hypothetical protein
MPPTPEAPSEVQPAIPSLRMNGAYRACRPYRRRRPNTERRFGRESTRGTQKRVSR